MSKIQDRLKQAEAQRERILAGRDASGARATAKNAQTAAVPGFIIAIPTEQIAAKEALEKAQAETAARLAAEGVARRIAEERALAEAQALATAREREVQSGKYLAEAQARVAAENVALGHAREREAAERNARLAAQAGAAADADAARLARERRQVEVLVAREARQRRRAQQRPWPPEASRKSLWLALGAFAAAGIFAASGFYGTAGKKEAITTGPPAGDFQLKLDRDLESFAQRLKESEKK